MSFIALYLLYIAFRELEETEINLISSFQCLKDSVYTFRAPYNKGCWYLGYSEDCSFPAADSLLVTDGTYELPLHEYYTLLGFYKVQEDGYLQFKMQGLNDENYIHIGSVYKKPVFVNKGEIYPVYVRSSNDQTVALTIELLSVANNPQRKSALTEFNEVYSANQELSFSSLSHLANINEWDFNEDGITDAYGMDVSYKFTMPGYYKVRLITGNCGGVDTLYYDISIDGACEDYQFFLDDELTLKYGELATLTAVDGTTWSTGDIGSEIEIQNYVEQDSSFTVWAMCQVDSCIVYDTISVTLLSNPLSVVEEKVCNISVYPTIVTDQLFINARNESVERIMIVNEQGIIVRQEEKCHDLESISLNGVSKGYYIVVVQTASKIQYFKIIKQ